VRDCADDEVARVPERLVRGLEEAGVKEVV